MPGTYDALDPVFRRYVDALVEHAQTALWPERRAALESFRRGIAGSAPGDLRTAVEALGLEVSRENDPAETIFRAVVAAYIERLGEEAVTNPDQAAVYEASLDSTHVDMAVRWARGARKTRGPSSLSQA